MSNFQDEEMPDDKMQDEQQDDQDSGFDSLDPQDQNTLIKYVMQGKPSTPQNMNAARNMLLNDPETVQSLCEKLGINGDHAGEDGDK